MEVAARSSGPLDLATIPLSRGPAASFPWAPSSNIPTSRLQARPTPVLIGRGRQVQLYDVTMRSRPAIERANGWESRWRGTTAGAD